MRARLGFLFSITSLILILAIAFYLLFFQQRIGYVNSSTLVNNFNGMAEARKSLEQKQAGWRANVDTLSKELTVLMAKFEKEKPGMSVKERESSTQFIHTKRQQRDDYERAMVAQMNQEQAEMTRNQLAKINAFLKQYGKEKGYSIVVAVTEYGNVAYADEGLDITGDVLEGLNKEYTKK